MLPEDIFQSLFYLKIVSSYLCIYFLPKYSSPSFSHRFQPEPLFPGAFPRRKSESLLITTTITQQIRRDLGPFPHHLPSSLMRKSSPANAGSLLHSLRQDTARQYIFIKAHARSCSRGLGFNAIYGEPLSREIMEPPV